jgi:very-short-patch-repair endonuclease
MMRAGREERVAAVASRQHGVVTRAQLREAGLTRRVVERRLEEGTLRVLHRGVYRVGPLVAPRSREMAAVLACGAGARASHRSAGWLWDLSPRPGHAWPVEVKVRAGRVVRRPGIRAYRTRGLEAEEVATVDGIPVTSPAQTLIDLAPVLEPRDLERAVARAERSRLVTLHDLGGLVAAEGRRPGVSALAAVLALEGGPAFTRSELEDRFKYAVRRFGLPAPAFNVRVGGHELDCYWTSVRLAVELDGAAYHGSWTSQTQDRRRDTDLAAHGVVVLRITWRQLVRETERTMVRVAQALAVRGGG